MPYSHLSRCQEDWTIFCPSPGSHFMFLSKDAPRSTMNVEGVCCAPGHTWHLTLLIFSPFSDQLYCLTSQSRILPICFKEIAIQYTFSNSNNMISQFSDFTLTIRVRVPYEENSMTSLRPWKMWAFCFVNKIFFARVMLQPKEEKLCVSFLFF